MPSGRNLLADTNYMNAITRADGKMSVRRFWLARAAEAASARWRLWSNNAWPSTTRTDGPAPPGSTPERLKSIRGAPTSRHKRAPVVVLDWRADDGQPWEDKIAMRIGFVGTGTMGTPIAG